MSSQLKYEVNFANVVQWSVEVWGVLCNIQKWGYCNTMASESYSPNSTSVTDIFIGKMIYF